MQGEFLHTSIMCVGLTAFVVAVYYTKLIRNYDFYARMEFDTQLMLPFSKDRIEM
jgi:hypothetical protein